MLLLLFLLSNCSKYITSAGDTRRSRSATIFDKKYDTNRGNKPPSKRLREKGDHSVALNSEASTITLIADNLKKDQNF